MMRNKQSHSADFLFPLILFFIFALLALFTILFSADIYSRITQHSTLENSAYAAVSYISQKIRRNDTGGNIYLGKLNGIDALILEQEINGSVCDTYIYQYDNKLYELYAEKDAVVIPQSGQALIEIEQLTITAAADQLFYICCTDQNGNTEALYSAVRSQQE